MTKQIASERQCYYAPWFRSHFQAPKRERQGFDLAAWTVKHNAMVERRVRELKADGYDTVTVERENEIKVKGETVTVAGKPDIVAWKADHVLVVDCKGGEQRHSDWIQVLTYMALLPISDPRTFGHQRIVGEVCYQTHRVSVLPEELTAELKAAIFAAFRRCGTKEPPPTTPSASECAFCDLGDLCADRISDEAEPVRTVEF